MKTLLLHDIYSEAQEFFPVNGTYTWIYVALLEYNNNTWI